MVAAGTEPPGRIGGRFGYIGGLFCLAVVNPGLSWKGVWVSIESDIMGSSCFVYMYVLILYWLNFARALF